VASVRILLTFDDGPHAGALGGKNWTEKVLDGLSHKNAKGAFFIQTHVPYRLASPNGHTIASRIHAEGHALGIHSGSFVDHRCHKWRCTQPADIAGTTNGLDSDMIRARAAIRNIVGIDPKFVRATYGYTDVHCMKVYSRHRLKHVYWDIVSGDDTRNASAASVRAHLEHETKRLATGARDLIYLLHDINQVTAENLIDYIEVIAIAVRSNGLSPVFPVERLEAEFILDRNSRPGTDSPCPPDSVA
jgi:peptidoglycan/xylan/chitin deacetylase (PgdA/CDA1 family)